MLNLKKSSVLVTGATGFLGRGIMAHLRRQGVHVVGTARIPASFGDKMVVIDLENYDKFSRLDDYGPFDAVLHCAAVLPGRSADIDLLLANQRMTFNLIKWAARNKVSYFLFASSCNVYGYNSQPCNESFSMAPPNLYAISKIACEHMIELNSAEIKSGILRVSAPYGPNLRVETVITRFLRQAAQGEPLTLLGSGRRSQDFVYEQDVASAFCLALSHQAVGTFNISGDRSVSMLELAERVLHLFGREAENNMVFVGEDSQEHYRGHFPIAAARQTFGYHPQVSLEEGLQRLAKTRGWL